MSTDTDATREQWICCQIGAREHYAIPRALQSQGALEALLTDAWVGPEHPLRGVNPELRERFHCELREANVYAFNPGSIGFEVRARIARLRGWRKVMARNEWFEKTVVSKLEKATAGGLPRTLFAYSYAALEILRYARKRGWRTVLGQIDPGPKEERIETRLYGENPTQRGNWEPRPSTYWVKWRNECEIADRIVVNSEWTQRALEEEGVAAGKIVIVPLAYKRPAGADLIRREYPVRFTPQRPLRILFLGQLNLRKGIGILFDAARLLRDEPVEFWFVGPRQIAIPQDLKYRADIRWFGSVPRSRTAGFYRDADVFIFPTFSDGFGITQLEAQAWKLPIIASRFCGQVVKDGQNGKVLTSLTAQEVVDEIRQYLADPSRLRCLASQAKEFEVAQIGNRLFDIFN
jgi:glycosyltransferase involved in cell wall biosynthesis